MQERRTPVRRRGRRKSHGPMILVAVLTIAIIGMIAWGAKLASRQADAQPPVRVSATTAPTTEPTQTEPAETVPKEEVPEPTVEQIVEEFAAQHGLTLEDYPEKLLALMERNPEAQDFVLNYPLEYGKDHEIDISGHADDEGVPLFIQWDKQWGYLDYAGNIAGLSACGPTSMAMVMYHFTRDPKYTPAYMMEFAMDNGYATNGSGTLWALFGQGGAELGLTVTELTAEQIRNEEKIAAVLDSGKVIVMNVSPGVFTTVGHFLVVTGYEDGKFSVNDPNSISNSQTLWEFETFADQIRMMWSFSL